jgi:C4-dicarboxylate transporter DctQ subunit
MLTGILNGLRALNRALEHAEKTVAVVTMAATTCITFLQVVSRYGFNRPLTWPEELSTLLLVWMTFSGAGILLRQHKHLEIDLFFKYFPKKLQMITESIIYFLLLAFSVAMIFGGYKLQALQSQHVTVALSIPKNCFSLPVLIWGGIMGLYLVPAFLKSICDLTNVSQPGG